MDAGRAGRCTRNMTHTSGALRNGILMTAIVTTGLLAGTFADWSNSVMPGLSTVDDRTFVESFQALDKAITSPLFLLGFMGALPLIGLAAALHLRPEQRRVLIWIGSALVAYLVAVIITFGVHEPLNVKLRTAGDPGSIGDLAAARALIDEARWTAWNTVRAVASTIAFGCLTWALVIRQRLIP